MHDNAENNEKKTISISISFPGYVCGLSLFYSVSNHSRNKHIQDNISRNKADIKAVDRDCLTNKWLNEGGNEDND